MDIPFELHVALRYLLAKRKQAFISVISMISTMGVAVGVMALVIALALMTGLQQELRNRILGSNAHVYVWKPAGIIDYRAEVEKLLRVPHVVGAAPMVHGQGLVWIGPIEQPLQLKGIDPDMEPGVTDIAAAMQSGSLSALKAPAQARDQRPGLLLGKDLATELRAAVGDSVTV